MSEDILLRIIAQDQYSAEMKQATAAVDKMTDAEKKSALAAKEHGDQLQKMGKIAAGAALAGITAVTAAIGDSIKETMDYSKSMRDLSNNIGMTIEETSRLVQTADDFTVSQEAVTSAMQMMVKRGVAPSIEGLAKIADQYTAIKDPVKQAALMTELLGRSWTSLTPMLKEGGQAIRDAAKSQSDALIVTEAQAVATRKLEVEMDNLDDTVTGLKLRIGNALIPVISEAASNFGFFEKVINRTVTREDELNNALSVTARQFGENSDAYRTVKKLLDDYQSAQESATNTTDASDRSIRRETDALEAQAQALSTAESNMALFSSTVQASSLASTSYRDETDKLILSTQTLTKETILKIASEGLNAESALRMARAMGMVDEKTATNIQRLRDLETQYQMTGNLDEYIRKVAALNRELSGLPSLKMIDIEMRFQTGGQAGKVGGAIGDDILDNVRGKGLIP